MILANIKNSSIIRWRKSKGKFNRGNFAPRRVVSTRYFFVTNVLSMRNNKLIGQRDAMLDMTCLEFERNEATMER